MHNLLDIVDIAFQYLINPITIAINRALNYKTDLRSEKLGKQIYFAKNKVF